MFQIQFRLKRRSGRVLMVDWPRLSVKLKGTAAGSNGAQGKGDNGVAGNVAGRQIDLLVQQLFPGNMSAAAPYPDLAVLNLKLADGKVSRALGGIGSGLLRRSSLAGGVSQAGVVPFAGIIFQECDVRIFYGKGADFDLARKNERHPFQHNGERIGIEKRVFAECRIVTDGK